MSIGDVVSSNRNCRLGSSKIAPVLNNKILSVFIDEMLEMRERRTYKKEEWRRHKIRGEGEGEGYQTKHAGKQTEATLPGASEIRKTSRAESVQSLP